MHPPDQPQPDASHWDSEHEAHTGFDLLDSACLISIRTAPRSRLERPALLFSTTHLITRHPTTYHDPAMPAPTTELGRNPDESDTTQTQPQGKKGKRKALIKSRMLSRLSDVDRKVKSDEPATLDVAASEKPKQAPGAIGNPVKRKSKTEEKPKDGKVTINGRSGRLARFWGTLFACFGTKALPDHDAKNVAGRVDNSSLTSSQETAHQAPSKKDNDIVDEKGIIRAEGADMLKEKVEDTASSRLTTGTGAFSTTGSDRVVNPQAAQNAQNNIASDSTTKSPTTSLPSISIPPLPIVVTTPVHTPHTPTRPTDAEETDTVIVPPTPSRASHTLPLEETQGLTAGAVVPPGATADDYHQNAVVGADDSEGTSFTDDEFHDAPEEDMEAEEARLVANGGSGIPSGPVSSDLLVEQRVKTLIDWIWRAPPRMESRNLCSHQSLTATRGESAWYLTWMRLYCIQASRLVPSLE
jgi:hypothetical protein